MLSRRILPWIFVLAAACGVFDDDDDDDDRRRRPPGNPVVVDVSVEEAFDLWTDRAGDPGFAVLDVRTPGEFAAGHIEGAINADALDPDFGALLASIDPGVVYLVHCKSGGRSSGAVAEMENMGFREVYHMTEGLDGWVAAGYPVVTDGPLPLRVIPRLPILRE